MNAFQIDADWFSRSIAAVIDLEPAYDYRTGERRTSPDGIPQWTLTLAMRPENARPSIAQISIASATELKLVPGVVPVFGGLQARYWQGKSNPATSGVMFTAESVSFGEGKRAEPVAA